MQLSHVHTLSQSHAAARRGVRPKIVGPIRVTRSYGPT